MKIITRRFIWKFTHDTFSRSENCIFLRRDAKNNFIGFVFSFHLLRTLFSNKGYKSRCMVGKNRIRLKDRLSEGWFEAIKLSGKIFSDFARGIDYTSKWKRKVNERAGSGRINQPLLLQISLPSISTIYSFHPFTIVSPRSKLSFWIRSKHLGFLIAKHVYIGSIKEGAEKNCIIFSNITIDTCCRSKNKTRRKK